MNKRQIVDGLDVFGKLRIYFHYQSVQLGLKHRFVVVDKNPLNPVTHEGKEVSWKHGRGTPDKEFGEIALYYLWKDLEMMTFERFLEGEIYEWYWRFEDEISI